MPPPRKNVTQATVVAPRLRKEGKAIEAPEPVDSQTNLSDIHIHDDEDSHSSTATLRRVLAAEPEPQHTNDQLHQMLFNLKK